MAETDKFLDKSGLTYYDQKSQARNGYWEKGEVVQEGDVRFLAGKDNAKYILKCTKGGTTGVEQPTPIGTEFSDYTITTYTKAEVDSRLANKLDKSAASNYATKKDLLDATMQGVDQDMVNNAIATATADKADKSDLSKYLPLNGGTMTGGVTYTTTNMNIDNTSTSQREDWRMIIGRNASQTVNQGSFLQIGTVQPTNSQNFTAMIRVGNPRSGNLPSGDGTHSGNQWGGIGVNFDYATGKTYPYTTCDSLPTSDNSSLHLATTAFVKSQGYLTSSSLSGYVPTSRTVNGKALSANITLSASDVGASASGHTHSYLPLSGGTMSGNITLALGKSIRATDVADTVYNLINCNSSDNVHIGPYGSSNVTMLNGLYFHCDENNYVACNAFNFYPGQNKVVSLGSATHRWDTIYPASGTITSSDARIKQDVKDYADKELDAMADVNFIQFKFVDSVNKKGKEARVHFGVIAQQVGEAFKKHDLNPNDYGVYCFDKWEAKPATEDEPAQEAGELYSIRYEELLCMEAAYQRRENEKLKARLKVLEEKLGIKEAE